MGHRVIGRPLRYHLFRHSSATYYATRLNRQELCYRYGWRFSSNMLDIYISRSGMESKAVEQEFTQTELSTMKTEVDELRQTARIKDERIRALEESMRTFQRDVAKVLKLKPSQAEVAVVLDRRRKA